MNQGKRLPLAVRFRATGIVETIVSIETMGLGVLLVDVNAQRTATLAYEIEQAGANTLAALLGLDEQHFDFVLTMPINPAGRPSGFSSTQTCTAGKYRSRTCGYNACISASPRKVWVARTERNQSSLRARLSEDSLSNSHGLSIEDCGRSVGAPALGGDDGSSGRYRAGRRANQRLGDTTTGLARLKEGGFEQFFQRPASPGGAVA